MDYTFTDTKNNIKIDCFNELETCSNFHVICENENYDGYFLGEEGFDIENNCNWDYVCKYLYQNYRKDIVEITAV